MQEVVVADSSKVPVAGRDDPWTWAQFLDWFPDDEACRGDVGAMRWKSGIVCPGCGNADRVLRGRCRHGRHQSTVTVGTIRQKTRMPLRHWLVGVWYIVN